MGTTITLTGAGDPVVITGEGVYEGATYDRLIGWHDLDAELRFEQRPSAPGAFAPRRTYTEARAISVEGQYFGSSRADALRMRERIARLYNDGRPITMTVADDLRTTSREVYVESIVFPWTIHREFRFDLDVRAADPRRYAPAATATTGPALSSGGLSLPVAFPIDFGVAGDDGRLTSVNIGNTSTGQRFTVSGGGMPDGFDIVNTTTGQRIRYLGPVSSELIGTELIATNLATNPSFETGSGTVEVRRNRAHNPCVGGSLANLVGGRATLSDGGTFVRATITDALQVAVAQLVATSTSSAASLGSATPGETYSARADARSSASFPMVIGVQFFDSSFAFITGSQTLGSAATTNPSTFTTLPSVTAVAPAGAAYVRWLVGISGTGPRAVGDTFDVRNVIVEQSANAGSFFFGGTSAGGDFTYAWTGTANASASVQNAVGVAAFAPAGGRIVSTANTLAFQSQEWSSSGTKSLRVRARTGTNNTWVAPGGDSGAFRLGMEPGKTYTAVGKLRLSAPLGGTLSTLTRQIVVFINDGSVTFPSAAAPNVAGVHEVRVTFSIPFDATAAWVRLYNGASAGNGDVWWDDFMLVEGTYTGDYFDGATADTYRTVYSWSGAPDASTSTATRQLYSESFVVIDTRLRTALINGTAPAARFLSSPEWWEIPAGSSVDIQFVPRGPTTGSPILTAETASAFY